MKYMSSLQLGGSLQFLKQARLFRLLNVPRHILIQQAVKMIWMFFAESSQMPVKVSKDVRKKLIDIAFDPEQEKGICKGMFSEAFDQVYNAVVPHFRKWVESEEWRCAVPFHRLAPPSFSIVLTSSSLCFLFNKFIKTQLEQDGNGRILNDYHLWKFCIIAKDFREGKLCHGKHLEKKKKKRTSDEPGEEPKKKTKEQIAEEYAKSLFKKYRHQLPLAYDGSTTYSVFIVRALDQVIGGFDKSPFFQQWIALKQYLGHDYQAKVVHQPITQEGFVEPPSLAGAMTSSMLPFFLSLMAGTEEGMCLDFLVELIKFRSQFDSSNLSLSVASSEDDGSTKKEMNEEAQRIFTKYLDSGDMYCDHRLVEEVRSVITKNGGKGITPSLFRKCGAFVFQRSEHTWCREARATLAWANKSYDNHCSAARAVDDEFSMNVLPEGIDLQIVPNIDDTFGNPELFKDYGEFIGKESMDAFTKFHELYMECLKLPVSERKPTIERVVSAFGDCAVIFPELVSTYHVLVKEIAGRERFSDVVLAHSLYILVRAISKKYFSRWLIEHSVTWKKVSWTPVAEVTFSDMSGIIGTRAIEKRIQEEAVKGKTGFARFIALRKAKKQSIDKIRSKSSQQLIAPSKTVFSSGKAAEIGAFVTPLGKSTQLSPVSCPSSKQPQLPVPSFAETLSSVYLRRLFERSCLSGKLSSAEFHLWEALHDFFVKYSCMDDEELYNSQDEMRRTINSICDKNKHVLKNSAQTKERAKKEKVLFPQFFRPEEIELYTEAFAGFQKSLRDEGWN